MNFKALAEERPNLKMDVITAVAETVLSINTTHSDDMEKPR